MALKVRLARVQCCRRMQPASRRQARAWQTVERAIQRTELIRLRLGNARELFPRQKYRYRQTTKALPRSSYWKMERGTSV